MRTQDRWMVCKKQKPKLPGAWYDLTIVALSFWYSALDSCFEVRRGAGLTAPRIGPHRRTIFQLSRHTFVNARTLSRDSAYIECRCRGSTSRDSLGSVFSTHERRAEGSAAEVRIDHLLWKRRLLAEEHFCTYLHHVAVSTSDYRTNIRAVPLNLRMASCFFIPSRFFMANAKRVSRSPSFVETREGLAPPKHLGVDIRDLCEKRRRRAMQRIR